MSNNNIFGYSNNLVSTRSDTTTNLSLPVGFIRYSTNRNQIILYDTSMNYNPSTQTLSVTNISGSVTGPASHIDVTETNTNSTYYITFVDATGTNKVLRADSSLGPLSYNPSTGVLTSTTFSGDGASLTNLTIANLNGTIPNSKLTNDNITIGSTSIDLGATTTTLAGLTSISSVGYSGGLEFISLDIQPNTDFLIACAEGIGTAKFIASRTGFKFNPSTDLLTCPNFSGDGSLLTNLTIANLNGTIPNSKLTNDNITIGSTSIDLGATSTTLAGLTSVTSTLFSGYCDGLDLGTFTGTKRFVFASGSLPGGNDVFSTSTSDICWDNTNKKMGIGNGSPDSTLSVNKFFSGGSGINLDNAISVQTTGDIPTNQYAFGLYTGSNTNTGNSYLQSGILDYRVGNNRNTANYNLLLQPLSGLVKVGQTATNTPSLLIESTSPFVKQITMGGYLQQNSSQGNISHDANMSIDSSIGSHLYIQFYNTGNTYIRNYIAISDKRIKKDIVKIENFDEVFELVKNIGSYKYKYGDYIRENDGDQYGFIAQEVLKYYPVGAKDTEKGYIPNIMMDVQFSYQWDETHTKYLCKIQGYELDVNKEYLFYVWTDIPDENMNYLEYIKPLTNRTFLFTPTLRNGETSKNYVKMVLVGEYIYDKLGVKKEKLFQVAFSAVNGLILENDELKSRIDILEENQKKIMEHLNIVL
jgi:hypothetical protein